MAAAPPARRREMPVPARTASSMRRTFVTPEGVNLQLELGSAGSRAAAFMIDAAIMIILLVIVSVLLALLLPASGMQATGIVWLIGFFVLRNGWFVLFEMGGRGATFGKRLMGLRVVARDGSRLTGGAVIFSGDATHLIDVANTEQNAELRRRAVQHLGTMSRTTTGEALIGIYAKEKDVDIKRSVVNALFVQNNAESLVAIARKETDPALKREMVSKLSLMTKSKVAMDYLMEILNK